MGIMNLNKVHTSLDSPLHGRYPVGLERLDITLGHFLGNGEPVREGNVGRAFHVIRPPAYFLGGHFRHAKPRCNGTGFPSRVRDLNPDNLVLAVRELNHPPHRLDLAILPESRVLGCDSAFGFDGCGFDRDESWSALRDTAQVSDVPVC